MTDLLRRSVRLASWPLGVLALSLAVSQGCSPKVCTGYQVKNPKPMETPGDADDAEAHPSGTSSRCDRCGQTLADHDDDAGA